MEKSNNFFTNLFRLENIFLVYIAIKPIYLFDSGLPQISDTFLFLCFAVCFFRFFHNKDIPLDIKKWIQLFVFTVIYQIVIQVLWCIVTDKNDFLHKIFFYVFNLIASVFFLNVFYKTSVDKMKDVFINGSFLSCIVILVGLVVRRTSGLRQTSFFNNPNQLGYYCLLIVTTTTILSPYKSKIKVFIIHLSALIGAVLSYSKGAILGILCTYFSYIIIKSYKTRPVFFVFYLLLSILLIGGVYYFVNTEDNFLVQYEALDNLRNRFIYMNEESDSDLYNGRGYGRVFEVISHIIWGVGEGSYDRFTVMTDYEIHSTFISILVSYGVIGLILYITLFFKAIRSKKTTDTFKNFFYLSGVLFYSASHNGIRNTFFWIVLSLIIILTKKESEENELQEKVSSITELDNSNTVHPSLAGSLEQENPD